MASKAIIEGMITTFSDLYGKRISRETEDMYYQTLSKYTDKQVSEAAYTCLETCKWTPKPADIIANIHEDPVNRYSSTNQDFLINPHRTCGTCGHVGLCIKEPIDADWECRQCYTGYTSEEISAKFRALGDLMRKMGESNDRL